MGFGVNGVVRPESSGGLNEYALVIYVPDPLGRFLDDLRRQLVPGCKPHAHVSVLPPRRLDCDPVRAAREARALFAEFEPFHIRAGRVEMFSGTKVIYLDVCNAGDQLCQMHAALSGGCLKFEERFQYHPHITLAQDLLPDQVEAVYRKAAEAWQQYSGVRTFRADRVVFVQNTVDDGWIDLEEFELGAVPVL